MAHLLRRYPMRNALLTGKAASVTLDTAGTSNGLTATSTGTGPLGNWTQRTTNLTSPFQMSGSHTATAGATVIVCVAWDNTFNPGPTGVTYGGTAMTQMPTTVTNTYIGLAFYYLINVSSGSNTVQVTLGTGSTNVLTVMSVGVLGVATSSGIGTMQKVPSSTGTATSYSQSVSLTIGQMAIQAFGNYGGGNSQQTPSGGTGLVYLYNPTISGANYGSGQALRYSTASGTTFSTSLSASDYGCGLNVILSAL